MIDKTKNFLYIDTATKFLYACILYNNKIVETINDSGFTHTENLALTIKSLFEIVNGDYDNIDYYIIGSGPGSFTGVRVGYSFIKGFSFFEESKFIEISTLRASAITFFEDYIEDSYDFFYNKLIIPLIFGRKNRFYGEAYIKDKQIIKTFDKTFEDLVKYIKDFTDKNSEVILLVSSEDLNRINREILKKNFKKYFIFNFKISPSSVIKYVRKNLENFQKKLIDDIQPFYLRDPDAIIKKSKNSESK